MLACVPRIARVPPGLAQGPFTLAEAAREGVHAWHLRGTAWRRVAPGTYVPSSIRETSAMKVEAASRRLPVVPVVTGPPRPQAQVSIRDRFHRFLGGPDLVGRALRLALEYDGGAHRDSLVGDNRRQNRLVDAGIRLLRFTAGDIFERPEV